MRKEELPLFVITYFTVYIILLDLNRSFVRPFENSLPSSGLYGQSSIPFDLLSKKNYLTKVFSVVI